MIKISAMPLSVLLFFAIVNVKIVSPYDAVKRRDYMSRNEEQDNDRVQNKGRGQDKAKESTKEEKQERGEELTRADLVPLTLCMLMRDRIIVC